MGDYRLAPGEPTGIAALSAVLAQAHTFAGGLPLSTVVEASGLHRDTVLALLTWHLVAGDDPEGAYLRGLEREPGARSKSKARERNVVVRLRRPRFDTLVRLAAAMGCTHPTKVAHLAVSKAPGVVLDVPETVG